MSHHVSFSGFFFIPGTESPGSCGFFICLHPTKNAIFMRCGMPGPRLGSPSGEGAKCLLSGTSSQVASQRSTAGNIPSGTSEPSGRYRRRTRRQSQLDQNKRVGHRQRLGERVVYGIPILFQAQGLNSSTSKSAAVSGTSFDFHVELDCIKVAIETGLLGVTCNGGPAPVHFRPDAVNLTFS